MSENEQLQATLGAKLAGVPCQRCGAHPSIEFTGHTGIYAELRGGRSGPISRHVTVCIVCLAELVASLPALYLAQFKSVLEGFEQEKRGDQRG